MKTEYCRDRGAGASILSAEGDAGEEVVVLLGGAALQRQELLGAVRAQRRAVRVLAEVHHVRRHLVATATSGE